MCEKISVISLFALWVCFVCTSAYLKGTSAALIDPDFDVVVKNNSIHPRHGVRYGITIINAEDFAAKDIVVYNNRVHDSQRQDRSNK